MNRLWVTDPLSPSSSGPSTPSHSAVHIPLASTTSQPSSTSNASMPSTNPPQTTMNSQPPNYTSPHLPSPSQFYDNPASSSTGLPSPVAPSMPASALPGARISGKLVGVVSLTDILNLHARASGLHPADPAESRSRRRRSSSSSVSFSRSGDVGRELFSR